MDYIHQELDQFHESFQVIRKNGSMIVRMTALSIAQLTIFFSIPYGIYRSFGLDGVSPVTVLAAQACVSMMSSFVPCPGPSEERSSAFIRCLVLFMPEEFLNMSILFWRIVTFYLPILVGMFFVARFHPRRRKTNGNDIKRIRPLAPILLSAYSSFFRAAVSTLPARSCPDTLGCPLPPFWSEGSSTKV